MCLVRAGRLVRAARLGEGRVFLGEGRAFLGEGRASAGGHLGEGRVSGGRQCVWGGQGVR